MLQPCLRESRHSNFTLDAIKFAMTNSTVRRILSLKFGFRWERSKDKKRQFIRGLKIYPIPQIGTTLFDRVLPGVGSSAEVTFLLRAENEIRITAKSNETVKSNY